MKRTRVPRRASAGALAALLAPLVVAGCGHSPPTRFFTLDPVAPTTSDLATTPYRGPPLRVDAVHIPPTLDRPEMVRETAANELHVDDFAHWAAPLGETARRALTQDLAARLPEGQVIFPEAPKPIGGAGLVVDILAFSETGDSGVLDASWTVVAPRADGSASASRTHVARITEPRAGVGPQADAAILSRLLARLADRIAADPTL